jgi:hypothetical protein
MARENAMLVAERARFAAGLDLATKLDARADTFLQPSLDLDARKAAESSADTQVEASSQKLDDIVADKGLPPSGPVELSARLWDGFSKGSLIDTPKSSLAQAAKQAGVDLLVTGTLAINEDYAVVQVSGYDASLDRIVFSWEAFCSVDDPAPAASEIAGRLEEWVAGRDFARIDINLDPPFAELTVDGERFAGAAPVYYAYASTTINLEATAPGYSARQMEVELEPGERKTLDIKLDPQSTGHANIQTNPTGAKITLDSVPVGKAPVQVALDGSKEILTASATGWETQTVVLPTEGEREVDIDLLPSDGQGPGGRITKAKDSFYQSLGWFVITIPTTSLLAGLFNSYDDAYSRSGSADLYLSRSISLAGLSVSAVACAATFALMVPKLIKYLASAH